MQETYKPSFRNTLLSMILVLFAFAFSFAEEGIDLKIKASVSATKVFVGDVFEYSIEVEAPSQAKIELPSFIGNLDHFEVKEMQNFQEAIPKTDKSKFIWRASLNTFVSGDFAIKPQQVSLILGPDSIQSETDPVAIQVLSRSSGEELDILEAEGTIDDPRMPLWVWVLLGILGALFLLFLGAFIYKKWSKKEVDVLLPPFEEAQLALKKLRARGLLEQKDQAEFFTELGFIARRYVQRRFGADILDATLKELRQRMSRVKSLSQNYKETMVLLAEETEPVKFAKMKLDSERVEFWDSWIDRLLEDTKEEEPK